MWHKKREIKDNHSFTDWHDNLATWTQLMFFFRALSVMIDLSHSFSITPSTIIWRIGLIYEVFTHICNVFCLWLTINIHVCELTTDFYPCTNNLTNWKKQHRNKSKSKTFQRVPVVKLELLNMAIYKSKHMKVIVIR